MSTSTGVRLAAVIALVALVACHPPPPSYIGVRGSEVSAHLTEMRIDGQAQLPTVLVVPGKGQQPAEVETVFFYQTVTVGGMTATLDVLATGCPDCALVRYRDSLIKLRDLPRAARGEAKSSNVPMITFTALALASLGGGIYCLAECESSKGLKSAGLGLGALVFGLVAYVLGGGTVHD